MALTNWKTWASGDVLTAADMNTYTRDNGRRLTHNATSGAPMCRVYNSATVTGVATGAKVGFDSERFDPNAMHDTVTNNSRLTVPTGGGGKYLIGSGVQCACTYVSGTATINVRHLLNNTTLLQIQGNSAINATTNLYATVTTIYALAATDYVETTVGITNYSNVDLTAASDYAPQMWAIWIGE